MKRLNSVTIKTLSFAFALTVAAGCASVTDANLDVPENNEPAIETTTTDGNLWDSSNGDDMDPIIDRPRAGGTLED